LQKALWCTVLGFQFLEKRVFPAENYLLKTENLKFAKIQLGNIAMTNPVSKIGLWGLLLLICLASGCVERKLTIRTTPENALVTLNDEEIGTSPVTVSFQWYADYNVRVTKAGYTTLETHQKLNAPWYDHFPFDFFAQVLYPKRIVNEHQWSFDLEPAVPADRDDVIQQAQALQQAMQMQPE